MCGARGFVCGRGHPAESSGPQHPDSHRNAMCRPVPNSRSLCWWLMFCSGDYSLLLWGVSAHIAVMPATLRESLGCVFRHPHTQARPLRCCLSPLI